MRSLTLVLIAALFGAAAFHLYYLRWLHPRAADGIIRSTRRPGLHAARPRRRRALGAMPPRRDATLDSLVGSVAH